MLALTSNPEGPQFQHAVRADGRTVADTVVAEVTACNTGAAPLGSVGVVIGATLDHHVEGLDALNGPLLAPGIGTQGGRPEDLPRIFGSAVRSVVPAVSRELLAVGPSITKLRDAADALNERCARAVAASS